MIEPRITKVETLYAMTCRVELYIAAEADVIWGLLTDASSYPRWNSTVTRIDGEIREGERIRIHVPGSRQTFTPRVSGVVAPQRMDWTGGVSPLFKGQRRFELTRRPDGSVDFAMQERFSGVVFMMVRRLLPDFGPIFARFATDLKTAAERKPAQSAQYHPSEEASQ